MLTGVQPRPGRRLLVLDLDYTLLDCEAWQGENTATIDFARPGLDDFLASVCAFGIATSMGAAETPQTSTTTLLSGVRRAGAGSRASSSSSTWAPPGGQSCDR
jgi:hypothetical protein